MKPWNRDPSDPWYLDPEDAPALFGKDRWVEAEDSDTVPLFHWAPSARRKGILRHGLVPKRRSVDGQWRPPYVCFADNPRWGWALSGDAHGRHSGFDEWDLWQTYTTAVSGYLMLCRGDTDEVHEVRFFEPVPKGKLWYVATRTGHTKTYRGTPASVLG